MVKEAQVEPEVKDKAILAPVTPTPAAPEKKSNSKYGSVLLLYSR